MTCRKNRFSRSKNTPRQSLIVLREEEQIKEDLMISRILIALEGSRIITVGVKF